MLSPCVSREDPFPIERLRHPRDTQRPTKMKRNIILYYLGILFLLPFILTDLPWIPVWLGRAMGVAVFIFFMAALIFWYGLSPKTKMIRGGKLSEPRFDKLRPQIEKAIRILVVAFGVFFFYEEALPLSSDLFH